MAKNQMTGSTVMSRAERAKIAEQQKLRAAIRAKAAATGVTAPKSAVDNFVSTYSKTKVGPIQRAVARFFEKIGSTYKASREDRKPVKPRTAPDTASEKGRKGTPKRTKPSKTSDEARSDARIADRQRRLAAKSAAQGGGSVLSNKKKKTTTSKPTAEGASAKRMPKKTPTKPTPPPARPKKNNKTTKPTPKPKLYKTIDPKTGKEVDKKVPFKQHLANLDAAKKKGLLIGSESRKTRDNKAKARDLIASAAKASLKKKGNN